MGNNFRTLKRKKKFITNGDKFHLLPKRFMSVDIHERRVQIIWKIAWLRIVKEYE